MNNYQTSSKKPVKDENSINSKKSMSSEKSSVFEEVRVILAGKARDGSHDKVREFILAFGGQKLTDLDFSGYKGMLTKAQGI